ncbi:MAG: nucleoside hydrolase [Chloroflexota bacterium]
MIIFDTDIGLGTPRAEIDDGAALIMLLRGLGDEVAAITAVHGNTTQNNVIHNTRRLLSYLEREDIPLGRGAAHGLIEDKAWFAEWQAEYGETPTWPAEPALPLAAPLIVETVQQNPGKVTILAVGPLTNLALALRLAPDIVGKVKQIVAMGGSFGQTELRPEFNAACDPEAAQAVLTAGWPIQLIGLNITKQIPFSRAFFASLADDNLATALLKQQAPGWIARVEAMGWGADDCSLHDALAVAAAMEPRLFTWEKTAVSVDLHPTEMRGVTHMLPPQAGKPTLEVATAVDVDACRALIEKYLK